MRNTFFILVFLLFALGACKNSPLRPSQEFSTNDDQLALETLVTFLTELQSGKYKEAVSLYGGPYNVLIDNNPNVEPSDYAGLLRNACTINGIECLQVRTAGLDKQISPNEFIFKVEFQNEDGTLFVRGPCCGGSETDQPSVSVFFYTVVKTAEGNFLVMELPPYVP